MWLDKTFKNWVTSNAKQTYAWLTNFKVIESYLLILTCLTILFMLRRNLSCNALPFLHEGNTSIWFALEEICVQQGKTNVRNRLQRLPSATWDAAQPPPPPPHTYIYCIGLYVCVCTAYEIYTHWSPWDVHSCTQEKEMCLQWSSTTLFLVYYTTTTLQWDNYNCKKTHSLLSL